jgi:hypothetical protein
LPPYLITQQKDVLCIGGIPLSFNLPDRVDPENGPVTVKLTSNLSDFVYFFDSKFYVLAPYDLPSSVH